MSTDQPPNQPSELQLAWQEVGRQQAINQAMAAEIERLVATNTALQAENTRLEELANRDKLTGLPNRRAFDERFDSDLNRALHAHQGNTGDQLVLIMFDFDGFKRINDTYGHPIGDALLRKMTQELQDLLHLRQSDMLARLGGDEFAIVALSNDPEILLKKVRDVQATIDEKYNARPDHEKVRLSIGYVVLDNESIRRHYPGHTLESINDLLHQKIVSRDDIARSLMSLADEDLYAEKAFRKFPFPRLIEPRLRLVANGMEPSNQG